MLGLAPILAIRAYQWVLRPLFPASCRFEPTCSHYAVEAIATHGPGRGLWLALRRVLRCNPWGGAGWDPVPPASSCRHDHGTVRADPSDRPAGPVPG